MKLMILLIAFFFAPLITLANEIYPRVLKVGSLQVSYAVIEPKGIPVGDVLYLHGYGDRFANHIPLFDAWTKKGFRVVTFDYPSHGLTSGGALDDLDWHSFTSLAQLAREVVSVNTANDEFRPLIIAGWSTGGLLAIRIAQEPQLRQFFPSLKGLVLYAPAISTWKCPGNHVCRITNETLTHNQELYDREISPEYPLARLGFAFHLMTDGWKSWSQPMPKDIPALVFIAGDTADRYANSAKLKQWVRHQQAKYAAPIEAIQCPLSRHELDNEPLEYGGYFVRERSADYASSIVANLRPDPNPIMQSPCLLYQSDTPRIGL